MFTTHPPRFLLAILERPEDDLPRRRYANWLDGCGNPLGEFIRLQLLIARNPITEPHMDFERRTQTLLGQFRTKWTPAFADRVDWYSYRRGFVEEIALTDRQLIQHASELFRHAPVRDIHLESDGRRLDALPKIPELKHTLFLDLSAQGLGDDGVERLADAPFLAHVHGLNLGSCFVGDDGLEALANSPYLENLRELYLNDNPITEAGIRQLVLAPLVEQLEILDVRFTSIDEESVEVLRHILGKRVLH
jgi:uncharacterized protein (TIGR02996 family)